MATFADFNAVLSHLGKLGLFHVELGLDRMHAAIRALLPDRLPFRVIQVLGTNGKGSTSAFLSAIASAHGLKTGLYTSPHFVSPLERIRIGGQNAVGDDWVEPANRIMAVAPDLTYFEFLTVLALLLFVDAGVEVAILEAGLGGRNDATTAIVADLLCYTPIALDHANVLGHGLADIARDKADAIGQHRRGPGRDRLTVCTARQFPVAASILADTANRHGARLVQAGIADLPGDALLSGHYQSINAGLALAAWRELAACMNVASRTDTENTGLARAFLPGRMQFVPADKNHPPLLLDGAHNPHGMQALLQAMAERCVKPTVAIYACLADKDWRHTATMLHRVFDRKGATVFVPALENPRAALIDDVAYVLKASGGLSALPICAPGAVAWSIKTSRIAYDPIRPKDNLPEADWPKIDPAQPVLVTGSLYLLAEVFSLFPALLNSPAPKQHTAK